ncbi:MAG: RidA family protein [Halobacteriales archaeon]
MDRQTYASGTEWERAVGYARAVRTDETVHVSGTTATDDEGRVVGRGDPYRQTGRAIENVERALVALDATLADVVRTRLFVTDIDDWPAVGRAHAEAFADASPASTMVQVERLVDPAMLVEIEAVARVGDP